MTTTTTEVEAATTPAPTPTITSAAAEAVADAEKTLRAFELKREQLIKKAANLASERNRVAYRAHVGDTKARLRLDEINLATTTQSSELASIDAAIVEANARLNVAKTHASLSADREQAEALRIKLSRFCELGQDMDDCMADIIGASNEMNAVLDDIHALGCAAPNANQLRVMATIAIKSFVMQIPWTAREWEHLPPNQRKTFAEIISSWRAMIENNISARSGTEQKEEAAA